MTEFEGVVTAGARFRDRYGLPVTTASALAAERYADGVERLLTGEAGGAACIEQALGADPDCALVQAAVAILRRGAGQLPAAAEHARRAVLLAQRATARERGHAEAVAALVGEPPARALARLMSHLEAYPRDALLAYQALMLMAAGAGAGDPAARVVLYERLAPHYGDDWWFTLSYAFELNEQGRAAEARPLAEAALARRPRNASAAHTYAHVLYAAGEVAAGAAFLAPWLAAADPGGAYREHNAWHLAVFELARARARAALAVYERELSPPTDAAGPAVLLATGAASLLWCCLVYGYPPEVLRWGPLRDYVARTGSQVVAFRALWDAHEAAAYAGAGDRAALEGLTARLRGADAEAYPAARAVVLPVAEGLRAFAAGAYAEAARRLTAVEADLAQLGGSNEQRDTFADTLIAAQLRAGQHAAAAQRLRRRLARRPWARDA
ncbi:MAG TPA: tetratricopeptide repeat protein, partial [Chloroflexota bacterium]|nr:tetratricopeptide repeat protein [Chloroflexota bacterium]